MNRLISVVGASGVGKTSLVNALNRTGKFITAYEQHAERPFQGLFKQDARYAFANQVDYQLLRAEQERSLRATSDPSSSGRDSTSSRNEPRSDCSVSSRASATATSVRAANAALWR